MDSGAREIIIHIKDAGKTLIQVTDNGCGMSPETLQSVFLPFASAFPEGTGLGMALVYRFVQQMGWEIDVQSAPGMGTRVNLTLPVRPAEEPDMP